MADISVTAANVLVGTGASTAYGTAGETITAGQTVYIDTADGNKIKKGDCDSGTVVVRTLAGVALNGGATGQPIKYITAGPYTVGGTVVAGRVYVLSDTAGGIMPESDLEAGDYLSILGWGKSTTEIQVDITNSATVVA